MYSAVLNFYNNNPSKQWNLYHGYYYDCIVEPIIYSNFFTYVLGYTGFMLLFYIFDPPDSLCSFISLTLYFYIYIVLTT